MRPGNESKLAGNEPSSDSKMEQSRTERKLGPRMTQRAMTAKTMRPMEIQNCFSQGNVRRAESNR